MCYACHAAAYLVNLCLQQLNLLTDNVILFIVIQLVEGCLLNLDLGLFLGALLDLWQEQEDTALSSKASQRCA